MSISTVEVDDCSYHEDSQAMVPSNRHENLSVKWNEGMRTSGEGEGKEVKWLSGNQLRDCAQRTHPAAAPFCRRESDVKRLAESLLRDGPQHPIVFVDGMLIDGRTRLEAALEANCRLPAIYYSEEELGEKTPFEFALACNCAANCVRRMTGTQIALARVKNDQDEIKAEREAAKERQRAGVKLDPSGKGTARQRLAAKYQVSTSRLRKAEAVVESGDADLYARCFRGEVSLHKAYLQVRPDSATVAKSADAGVSIDFQAEIARATSIEVPLLIATLQEVVEMLQAIKSHLQTLHGFNPGATVNAGLLKVFIDELDAGVKQTMDAQSYSQSQSKEQ